MWGWHLGEAGFWKLLRTWNIPERDRGIVRELWRPRGLWGYFGWSRNIQWGVKEEMNEDGLKGGGR